jgi:hypothetical protein
MNSEEPSEHSPSFKNLPDSSADETQPPPFFPKLPSINSNDQSLPLDPYWPLKWILAQNPFYIASAILLLYAMFRLSTDARIFTEEVSQLCFNFGSFQVYELMIAVTAIVLVRRKIFYDFSLLICIESLFAYVPFILISQALLIEGEMALKFSLLGCLLVLLRFGQLRKHFGGMNFRPRLLILGGVLLCVNVMLPLLVRYIHMGSTALNRDLRMNPLVEILWLLGAPVLTATAYFLPAPQRLGSHLLQRRTFPLTALSLWVFVTFAHLYCIGYIHEILWKTWYVVPALWTAAWMFYLRRRDVFERMSGAALKLLLLPAAAITLLAAREQQWALFFTLSGLNAIVYGALFLRQPSQFAFQLMSISVAGLMAGIPDQLSARLGFDFHRSTFVGIGILGHLLFQTVLSRNPKAGLCGAVLSGFACGIFFEHSHPFNLATQVGSAFLLLHSLRWNSTVAGADGLRSLGAGMWILHSAIWVSSLNQLAIATTASFGIAVFIIYCSVRLIFGRWGSRVVPFTAGLVVMMSPIQKLVTIGKETPIGVLVLIASFIFFALGTVLALTRSRWQKVEPNLTPATTTKTL